MKLAGTLKLEIIKPVDVTRMHALRKSLGWALNVTLRNNFRAAVDEIDARRRGEDAEDSWRETLEKSLRAAWSSELAALGRRDEAWSKSKKNKRRRAFRPEDYAPVIEPLSAETVDLLESRFTGEHLKDLIANRASMPSWRGGVAFSARSRACAISGKANEARLTFPLWATGKKATEFVVAPCGGHARAMWTRLVRDCEKRERVVALERVTKDKTASKADRARALFKLEETGAVKLGKVGISYNERKRKWYALVSWTQYRAAPAQGEERHAAVNFGCNVFMRALSEDGDEWDCSGGDILVTRERYRARRRGIQLALRDLGRGSRGRGKARRYLPVTKLDDRESRWVETRIRQIAADLISWCVRHRVTDLHLEDLAGVRESFENSTEGEAPEQVKRLIHSWPYYQARLAIEREGSEHGVRCHVKATAYVSQRCPSCAHTSAENVTTIDRGGDYRIIEGKVFKSVERVTVFKCVECGLRGAGDTIACANHLGDIGRGHALEKRQEKARKRITKAKERLNNG